ncbi:MAG: hypothetical protein Ta2B_27040 [Termitinemataceae bacterium]|nr:MAG: hypothetical protein Ta2B_27040 [Termitinemataceae bacterium]
MKEKDLFAVSLFLFVNFILIACISPSVRAKPQKLIEQNTEPPYTQIWDSNPVYFASVLYENPIPGSIETVIFLPAVRADKKTLGKEAQTSDDTTFKASLYNLDGKRLSRSAFFKWDIDAEGHSLFASVFAVPSTANAGAATIKIEGDKGFNAELTVNIAQKDFTAELIPLNAGNTKLRTEPDPQKTKESVYLTSIYETRGSDIYSTGPFTPPVAAETRRTSFFGDRRVYKYSNGKTDTSIHAGIDYGVPTGTKVAACAPAKVVLARPRIVTGNSIVLEHLPGVYTTYFHLDKILVTEGSMVETGALIGLSGSTGLATGPHLHWEIRAANENTDPDILCAKPILDKNFAVEKIIEHLKDTSKY